MIRLALSFILTCLLYAPCLAANVTTAFSPGNALTLVLNTINGAQKSIHVAAYSFTSKPISEALVAANKRGIDVRVIADAKSNSDKYTAVTFLANQGVNVRLNSKYSIMHNKFMIIDGAHVETGSFNYTAGAAMKNAENVVVLRDMPEVAAAYEKEWLRLWSEGVAMGKGY